MKTCRQLQFLSIYINRRETEIMRSHEINMLVCARMGVLWGTGRAIWLAGSVESELRSLAALCPSFQFPVSVLSAAQCAAEA